MTEPMTPLAMSLPTVPVLPGPDDARELLRTELDRPEYRPGLFERIRAWFADLFETLFGGLSGTDLPTWWILLVLLGLGAALVALVVWVLLRGRGGRTGHADEGVFDGRRLSAASHRAAAQRALADGDHDLAVVEAVRALAAGLIERSLLADAPDLTVHELTQTAAARFASERESLVRTGQAFDEVRYGDRHADAETARAALELEQRIAGSRPGDGATGPVAAVPR